VRERGLKDLDCTIFQLNAVSASGSCIYITLLFYFCPACVKMFTLNFNKIYFDACHSFLRICFAF